MPATLLTFSELATKEKLFAYAGSETVSGNKLVDTGLEEVQFCVAELDQFPTTTHDDAFALLNDQTNEPGTINLLVTKPTAAAGQSSNQAPTTAATAAKVKWIALGSKPGLM
tara:strand:+ start:116 stop:451 length:336 start_codon:yes stop_codon:yes gene_type:complete